MSFEALVFRHRPLRQTQIEIAKRRIKGRLIKTTIVRDPAPDNRVEHSRQVVDPFVHATAKLPVANFLSYRFCRRVADAGTEVDEVLAPAILRPSSPKSVAQIVEFLVWVSASTVVILAVDDFRLRGMKLQTARSKASLKRVLEGFRLLLAMAMAEDVIGKTLERYRRIMLRHPPVERVGEKEIAQQG